MIIEIQYLKEQSAFRINVPEDAVQNVIASALDDKTVNVSIVIRDKEDKA